MLIWARIDKAGPGLHSPKRAGDVGWDMEAAEDVELGPGEQHDIPTNVRIRLPLHCWGEIRARSSIARRGLMVPATVIDNGYTGHLFALVYNANSNGRNGNADWAGRVKINKGERIAQLVVHQGVWLDGTEVQELENDPRRGEAGFGSTGV